MSGEWGCRKCGNTFPKYDDYADHKCDATRSWRRRNSLRKGWMRGKNRKLWKR